MALPFIIPLAIGACAPSVHSTALRPAAPKLSAADVQIFTDSKPDRPYEEIGVMEVSAGELSGDSYGDLIQRGWIVLRDDDR